MFRMAGLPERDSVEEKRRTREAVVSNMLVFASLVGILRLSNYSVFKYAKTLTNIVFSLFQLRTL